MHLAHFFVFSGVSPMTSSTVHPLDDCLPVGALRDSWSWRDLFTGAPKLFSVDQRVPYMRRIQCTRDLDRFTRGDLPTWETSR